MLDRSRDPRPTVPRSTTYCTLASSKCLVSAAILFTCNHSNYWYHIPNHSLSHRHATPFLKRQSPVAIQPHPHIFLRSHYKRHSIRLWCSRGLSSQSLQIFGGRLEASWIGCQYLGKQQIRLLVFMAVYCTITCCHKPLVTSCRSTMLVRYVYNAVAFPVSGRTHSPSFVRVQHLLCVQHLTFLPTSFQLVLTWSCALGHHVAIATSLRHSL